MSNTDDALRTPSLLAQLSASAAMIIGALLFFELLADNQGCLTCSPIAIKYAEIPFLLIIILGVVLLPKSNSINRPVIFLLVLYCTLSVISYLIKGASIGLLFTGTSTSLLPLVGILFGASTIANKVRNRVEGVFAVLAVLIPALQLMTTAVLLRSLEGYEYKQKLQIPIGGSNFIASILVLGFWYFLFANFGNRKILKILTLLAIVGAIVITSSGAGLLTLVAGLVVAGIVVGGRRYLRSGKVWAAIVGVIAFMAVIVLPSERFKSYFEILEWKLSLIRKGEYATASSGRVELFSKALKDSLNNPLFGTPTFTDTEGQVTRAHNWFFDIWLERGGPAALVYTVILIVVGVQLYRAFRQGRPTLKYLFILGAAICHGSVEPLIGTRFYEFLLWMFLGFGLAQANAPADSKTAINTDMNPERPVPTVHALVSKQEVTV